jgi:hypothetical protein
MNPDRPFVLDDRWDIECLVQRARIILPEVILPDGTASPSQVAIVPPGVSLAKAFLPYRELFGPATSWTGAALGGTREPELLPYADGFAAVPSADGPHRLIARPQSAADILAWLYDLTGYRYAPAAFWKVAGWEIGWAAHWLDRLYTGGAMAELIVAERQAAAAVRAMWIVRDQHRNDPSLVPASGALLAARAVIDMVAGLNRVIRQWVETQSPLSVPWGQIDAACMALGKRLRSCVTAITAATAARRARDRHQKLGSAIHHARRLLEAAALFTVASEDIGKRVVRITQALQIRKTIVSPVSLAAVVDASAVEIEALATASDPPLVSATAWCDLAIGDLDRLEQVDPASRLTALADVRTDLVYKLIVTRRLDRLLEALPWMMAPSGAFSLTFGGPPGAVAALFEVARAREIALELKRRVILGPNGQRLDTRQGKHDYGSDVAVRRGWQQRTRAGFLLTTNALSHHMVRAWLGGRPLDPHHPLPTLEAGRLDWTIGLAVQDPATNQTMRDVELAKPIYATNDYDRDLPRYMGMTLADVLAAPLLEAFPGEGRDPGFGSFVQRADAQRRVSQQGEVPHTIGTYDDANRELLRSVLKSLDMPTDGSDAEWRPNGMVARAAADVELAAFDERHGSHIGRRAASGQAIRKRASAMREKHEEPDLPLTGLVNRARVWPQGKGKARADDRPLLEVIAGETRLPSLVPVAQTFTPVLWFRPAIDSHLHAWIASGAPAHLLPTSGNPAQAQLIAREVQAVTEAMPLLFGMPILPALRERLLVPLWTGLAGITADHAHVW